MHGLPASRIEQHAMSTEATYPVQVLREHTTALEAALSVCLADPTHKPVHRLRTQTRRIEAQLLLLRQLPEVPEHLEESADLLKQLKHLRRSAGDVRDLDVQRKLLEEYCGAESFGSSPASTSAKAARKPSSSKHAGMKTVHGDSRPAQHAIEKGADELLARLGKRREQAAADLQKLLKKRQAKASRAAEALNEVLHDAEELPLRVDGLLHHAHGLIQREGLIEPDRIAGLKEDELHSVRKAAKAARYLAETLPGNPEAVTAAQQFEALQEAGGQWHDLLDLTRTAHHFLGKTHELTVTLATARDHRLQAYRNILNNETQHPKRAQPTAPRSGNVKHLQRSSRAAMRSRKPVKT